ncbi:ATP-binding cassette domain-containing protein [Gordonia jinghuaiqii]|uniref:ABC transporter ATP-binding protein n=1 Tax=Gordonia jinghuaiqii TaxID=2758710 RepID=A0A7D7R173_9ACTN|nr:ABC transporter ATP-binding protein [Gordonia jinghuaiqii]MCR5977854.1 ATP-binding cassette domain-containing protein [Gordonia jinghuaiqii]QMT02511.1 ABC transporter ATP-binding protein [Gordonia jinghuaiqii]
MSTRRSDPAVVCRGVSAARGGVEVLHDVDLEIPSGAWVSLVGPNGSGKTTLLHALAGLVEASGHLDVAGVQPRGARRREIARAVALMPQRPVVPEGTTVRELIGLGRTPHISRFGSETKHDLAVVDSVIERLELGEFAPRQASALSGGELQRVVLARALAQQPRVLLLDEPTSALDIGHQQQVLDLVDSMRRDRELTVLAAMHDLTSAAQYGQRLVLLDRGRIVADGPPAEVLTVARLNEVYAARVEVLDRRSGPAVLPLRSTPPDVADGPE